MGKQNVTHTYHGILFSHKMECCTDRCYNMDEPHKWKKPDTNDHILYASIYRIGKSIGRESRLEIVKGWGKGVIGKNCLTCNCFFAMYENVREKFTWYKINHFKTYNSWHLVRPKCANNVMLHAFLLNKSSVLKKKITVWYHFTPTRTFMIEKADSNKCWREYGETKTLIRY